jgi:glutathione S-transferase
VKLDRTSLLYCGQIMQMAEMKEWTAAAKREPDEIDELDMDF